MEVVVQLEVGEKVGTSNFTNTSPCELNRKVYQEGEMCCISNTQIDMSLRYCFVNYKDSKRSNSIENNNRINRFTDEKLMQTPN